MKPASKRNQVPGSTEEERRRKDEPGLFGGKLGFQSEEIWKNCK